jgi:hypothetical protein
MRVYIDKITKKVQVKHFDHQILDDVYPDLLPVWIPEGTRCKHDEPLELTAEQQAESIKMLRQQAYKQQTDGLYLEALYDSIKSGKNPDFSAWVAKVDKVKTKYPKK